MSSQAGRRRHGGSPSHQPDRFAGKSSAARSPPFVHINNSSPESERDVCRRCQTPGVATLDLVVTRCCNPAADLAQWHKYVVLRGQRWSQMPFGEITPNVSRFTATAQGAVAQTTCHDCSDDGHHHAGGWQRRGKSASPPARFWCRSQHRVTVLQHVYQQSKQPDPGTQNVTFVA